MKEAATVINALYTTYLARDFFAKVIPGAVIILTLIAPLTGGKSAKESLQLINEIPLFGWLFVYGLCYIAGFAVQEEGKQCQTCLTLLTCFFLSCASPAFSLMSNMVRQLRQV
jgi:hypothetical protein